MPAVPTSTSAVTVVAHRGSSQAVAEHTLAAYRQAIEEGADALECDVRLTRDGVLVCVHDRRVDRTSDGRGVVSTLELADLAQLDFGSWRSPTPSTAPDASAVTDPTAVTDRADPTAVTDPAGSWEEPDHDLHGVLTLERLLQLVLECGRPVQLHVETKHPTRHAGKVERSLVELLGRYRLADPADPAESRVVVMSFAVTSLRRLALQVPALPTVLLLDRLPLRERLPVADLPRWVREMLPTQASIAGPSLPVLRDDPDYVARVHELNRRVHVWTVNAPADVDFVLGLGVDAVITDRPAQVLARLGRA